MVTGKIKSIIFDMDGTLIDSLILWGPIWSGLGKKFLNDASFYPGEALDREARTLCMLDAMTKVHNVCHIGKDPEELVFATNEIIRDFYANEVQLKKGVREFLDACFEGGVRMCIASATDPELLEVALDSCDFRRYFPRVFSCGAIGKGKESPDVFLYASDFLGTAIEDTWVFEDSATAIVTANRAGFKTCGIYDRNNFGQDIIKATSDIYIDDGDDLASLIKYVK